MCVKFWYSVNSSLIYIPMDFVRFTFGLRNEFENATAASVVPTNPSGREGVRGSVPSEAPAPVPAVAVVRAPGRLERRWPGQKLTPATETHPEKRTDEYNDNRNLWSFCHCSAELQQKAPNGLQIQLWSSGVFVIQHFKP